MLPLPTGREASAGVGAPVYTRHRPKRADWGNLMPADTLPDDLPEPPPTGGAQPLFIRPDW